MSSYFAAWKEYIAMQEAAALVIVLLGLGLALGWSLIDRNIPPRWAGLARWVYLGLGAGLVLFAMQVVA